MILRGRLITALIGATLLAGCDGNLPPTHGVAGEPADQAPAGVAAVGMPTIPEAPAQMRIAQASDLMGSWQMVQLPPSFAQPSRPTAPFTNPWQWFIISPADPNGAGRIGFVTRADAPAVPVNDQILADAWAQTPMFDTYRMSGGVMSVTPVSVTGWSAQGTQTWQVYMVSSPGLMLGMRSLPGDVLMVLSTPDHKPLYYRVLRRIPRAEP